MASADDNSIADEAVGAALASTGWTCVDEFLAAPSWHALARECAALRNAGALLPATVGRARVRDPALRDDATRWLDAGGSDATDAFLARLDALRTTLNRTAFLGLADSEAHFAHYPPGARYARHRDRFRDDDRRTVSIACYLNEGWDAQRDGGALRLYDADGTARDVAPLGGRAVLFLSADFEHEVLPAARDRFSIAGWLRTR